jgi:hypothetical protein
MKTGSKASLALPRSTVMGKDIQEGICRGVCFREKLASDKEGIPDFQ